MAMIKRYLSAFFAALIILLSFASCSSDDGTGKTITVPIDSEPLCLDPQIASDKNSFIVIENCMEGLIRIENGEIVSGVAKEWTVSPDGLVYTFKLRNDAVWHTLDSKPITLEALPETTAPPTTTEKSSDSTSESATINPDILLDSKITAHDFVFGISRALDSRIDLQEPRLLFIKGAAAYKNGSASLSSLGIRAVDNFTLEITLENENEDFLNALASPAAMPCSEDFFEYTDGKYGLNRDSFLSNGPFYLSRWTHGDSLRMKVNDKYVGDNKALPEYVILGINTSYEDQISRFKTGGYDAISLTGSQYSAENLDTEKMTVSKDYSTCWVMGFNAKNERLKNYDLRRALCLAADFSVISDFDSFTVAKGLIPPGSNIDNVSYREVAGEANMPSQDISSAKSSYAKSLEAAENEDGLESGLKMICLDNNDLALMIGEFINPWQESFGEFISIEPLPMEELMAAVDAGSYDIAIFPISATNESAISILSQFESGSSLNKVNYSSEDYDNLLSQIIDTTNEEKISSVKNAENKIISDYIVYPLLVETSYFIQGKGISGIDYNYFSGQYTFFKALKAE